MTLYATVILILAVLVALKIMARTSKARRRSGPGRVEKTRSATALKPMGEHAEAADAAIPLQQLDMVRRSAYRKRALMNKSEYALFLQAGKIPFLFISDTPTVRTGLPGRDPELRQSEYVPGGK